MPSTISGCSEALATVLRRSTSPPAGSTSSRKERDENVRSRSSTETYRPRSAATRAVAAASVVDPLPPVPANPTSHPCRSPLAEEPVARTAASRTAAAVTGLTR